MEDLYDLIDKRIANKDRYEQIDEEIYDKFGCVGCVLFTDLCGFTSYVNK